MIDLSTPFYEYLVFSSNSSFEFLIKFLLEIRDLGARGAEKKSMANDALGENDALTPSTATSRGSLIDSFRSCGIRGGRFGKADLRRRVVISGRLRAAMAAAIRCKDPSVAVAAAGEVEADEELAEAPMVVFVNCRSGGRHGPVLKGRLQELIGEEQVFDLSAVKPSDFVQYGLSCLEMLAKLGDYYAKVAGGDGTVGWVLGCLGELYINNREPVPPTGIIPLGTGNDLSRSFGWGASFPFAWRTAVKRSLYKAITGPVCRLDSWRIIVSMPAGQEVDLPHSLRNLGECTFNQGGDIEGELPEKGMDAQVAYGFHHLRDEKPFLAQGPIANKLIYAGYTCKQGWFFTPCISDPCLRGLKNILRLSVKKVNCSEWTHIPVPSSVRAIVALNLHNYASGRNPWGNLKPDYLEKRGFLEAHVDDGLLEIFGLKQGWHASLVMVELISAKHLAQAAAIRLEIRGGQWRDAYMQMDGEPWRQPMDTECSTFVEIIRVPFHSLVINGE